MEYVSVQGERIPALGLGTWRLTGRDCFRAVSTALDLGYRHVDTARTYGNEQAVGEAIAASDVDRDEVFLVTKVPGRDASYDDALRAARTSVRRLGVDRVDLLLLHWPNRLVPVEETMRALADCRERGLTRHVGVSNFSASRLRTAMRASPVPLLADQVRFHPYHPQPDLLALCRERDVCLTAYSPLAHGGVVADDTLGKIGSRYGKTPAQVALRWAIQHDGVAAIPKATSRRHLAENLAIFDFSLTRYEMEQVEQASLLRTGVSWVRSRLDV